MTRRVAFLGAGLMGAPMARRLLGAGFDLHAWNRSPEKVAGLASLGAVVAATPAQAAAGADFVCLCLTDAEAVEHVLFGPDGAAAALAPGAVIVDFSTIGPEPTRAFAAKAAAVSGQVSWVDAPVTGGVKGAEEGALVILCGGAEEPVEAAAPVFAPLARQVRHLGPLGAGQAAKLCNQLIVAVNVAAIAEALSLAKALGLDPALLPAALAGGWADSLPLQIIGRRMAAGVAEPPIVAIGTFGKDLRLVLAEASRRVDVALAAGALYAAAEDAGIAKADASALLAFVEDLPPPGVRPPGGAPRSVQVAGGGHAR